MTIKGLHRKVSAMSTDKVIDQAFDQTLEKLADINRERMNDGVRADGSIMPNYSRTSVEVFGYPPGPIKLKATGAFQAGIGVKRSGNVLSTESTDEKNSMLESTERYQPIFGTSGDYKKQYIAESLRPALNKEINAQTGLKFGP